MACYLGTSGWTYDHWKGVFYPDTVPKKRWFEYYSSRFDTVELNASFYRIPTVKTALGWYNRSQANFRFAVKMSRLVSHVRRLKNCDRELEWFFSSMEPLKPKTSIILIQLPPNLRIDLKRLDEFSARLPSDQTFAFEFRNITWYSEETYALLREREHTFCIHDMAGLTTDKIITANTVYIRFHGYDSRYGGDYPDDRLCLWAEWIREQLKKGLTVFAYFNNDIGGFAVKNCLRLKEIL